MSSPPRDMDTAIVISTPSQARSRPFYARNTYAYLCRGRAFAEQQRRYARGDDARPILGPQLFRAQRKSTFTTDGPQLISKKHAAIGQASRRARGNAAE